MHEPNILSDHCLIDFSFSFNGKNKHSETHASTTHQAYTYAWNSENKTSYTEMLNSEIFIEKLNVWVDSVDNCCSANDIDVCITHFGDIFDDVLSPLFKRQHRSQGQEYFPSRIDKRWFNAECAEKRINFYRHLNIFRNNKTEENKRNFIDARTQFKTCIRKSKFEYDHNETKKLLDARFNNAKLYWKMLKNVAGLNKSNIPLDMFKQYFESINNPDSTFFTPDEDVLHFIERYENNEFKIMFEELNLPISMNELKKLLKKFIQVKAQDLICI